MDRRLRRYMWMGAVVLAAGCVNGAGLATDLPQPRSLPRIHDTDDVLIPRTHPSDGLIIARERAPKWRRNLDGALSRFLLFPPLTF